MTQDKNQIYKDVAISLKILSSSSPVTYTSATTRWSIDTWGWEFPSKQQTGPEFNNQQVPDSSRLSIWRVNLWRDSVTLWGKWLHQNSQMSFMNALLPSSLCPSLTHIMHSESLHTVPPRCPSCGLLVSQHYLPTGHQLLYKTCCRVWSNKKCDAVAPGGQTVQGGGWLQ